MLFPLGAREAVFKMVRISSGSIGSGRKPRTLLREEMAFKMALSSAVIATLPCNVCVYVERLVTRATDEAPASCTRSEERRVGKECVCRCRFRRSSKHQKKKTKIPIEME